MKQKKRASLAVACAVTGALACVVAAPMVGAYEEPADPAPSVSSETVSQYNLASENWEELLGVASGDSVVQTASEEPAMTTSSEEGTSSGIASFWHGNQKSDGGLSRLLIIAIIAFALGAVGVTFFIYSQFIYKAKIRRKMAQEESIAAPLEDISTNDDLRMAEPPAPEQPEQPKPEQPKQDNFFDDFEKQTKLPTTQEIQKLPNNSNLTEEDEKKLNEVDWDDFFNNNK